MNNIRVYLLSCLIATIHMIFQVDSLRNKMFRIDRLEVCYMPENPPYIIHYVHLKQLPDRHYSASGSGEVLEELHAKDLDLEIKAARCNSRELLDSCENLPTVRPPTNVCNLIRIKEMGVREAMDKFSPPMRCPIQKTNYSLNDLRYDINKFTLFPIGNYYYKVKANGFYKKRLVGTLCFEGQAVEIKGKIEE